MTAPNALLRTAAAAALALTLGGCISLLPKTEPAQLYRFGPVPAAAAPAATTPPAATVGLLKPPANFARATAGDRILTVEGPRAAYVAEARWMAPAALLFDEVVAQAYDANPGPARLVSRGEMARADYVLRLDVRNFEAVYEAGPKAAPVAVVRVRAVVTRTADRALIGEQVFEARAPAAENRVSAIVAAFDTAVGDVVPKLVTWTNTLPVSG